MSNFSRSQIQPDLTQDGKADTSDFTRSSSVTTDWKSLAEKASTECAQAKATIGDLFLERLQTAKRIRELEDEVTNLRGQIALLEARPAQSTPSQPDEDILGAVDRQGSTLTQGRRVANWQVYSKYADSSTTAEIIERLGAVNEEIFQAAALLGESLVFHPRDTDSAPANDQQVGEELIGKNLVNMLLEQANRPQPEANPLLVQVTLQAFLVSFCAALVQSWYPKDPACASLLSSIYSKVRNNEDQEIIGTWRAITRTYTQSSKEGWREPLISKLACVLRLACWKTPSTSDRLAFEQKLEPIFNAVDHLRLALGTKFTSADVELSLMAPGQVFQHYYMEDAYGDAGTTGQGAPREIVMGTTGMGLKQAVKERAKNGDVLYKNVVSAKVALESTLLEALRPPPPRKSKRSKPSGASK